MKIKFFNPVNLDRNLKATVHRSGKLGFTIEAANKLELTIDKSAAIGINEDDDMDSNLYVIIYPDKKDGAFKISKAGGYYYINTKALFDTLKVDYLTDPPVYDIVPEIIENQHLFKFKRREKQEKND
jgi:hypothetical protein